MTELVTRPQSLGHKSLFLGSFIDLLTCFFMFMETPPTNDYIFSLLEAGYSVFLVSSKADFLTSFLPYTAVFFASHRFYL